MKRAIFVLLPILMVMGVGCATPQVDPEDGLSAGATESADTGPRKLDVKPGTLRMRAPAPATAMRPPDRQSGSGQPVEDAATVRDPAPSNTAGLNAYRLKKGDPIIVTFRGVPQPFSVEDIVDENGMITLPYIGVVLASGKSSSELEKVIFDLYVPDYYRYMNVNVLMPTQRSYYVQGAVRGPGRHPFSPGMTLMRAISTAGGYTDFSNRKKVKLLREGTTTEYNMYDIQENPERDVILEPADVILVPEKWY